MGETDIGRIVNDLLLLMPILHKRLLRFDLGGVTGDLTRLHLAVMGKLRKGDMTASQLGKTWVIPKPQVTRLISQLVASGIVERHPDTSDRRVTNLALTEHGRVVLGDVMRKVKEDLKKRLTCLTAEELTEMSQSLETLHRLSEKLRTAPENQ